VCADDVSQAHLGERLLDVSRLIDQVDPGQAGQQAPPFGEASQPSFREQREVSRLQLGALLPRRGKRRQRRWTIELLTRKARGDFGQQDGALIQNAFPEGRIRCLSPVIRQGRGID
jgi:hypothetical protein